MEIFLYLFTLTIKEVYEKDRNEKMMKIKFSNFYILIIHIHTLYCKYDWVVTMFLRLNSKVTYQKVILSYKPYYTLCYVNSVDLFPEMQSNNNIFFLMHVLPFLLLNLLPLLDCLKKFLSESLIETFYCVPLVEKNTVLGQDRKCTDK